MLPSCRYYCAYWVVTFISTFITPYFYSLLMIDVVKNVKELMETLAGGGLLSCCGRTGSLIRGRGSVVNVVNPRAGLRWAWGSGGGSAGRRRGDHSLFLLRGGGVRAVGKNAAGVLLLDGGGPSGGGGGAGRRRGDHFLFLLRGGVRAVGKNANGQLGDGSKTDGASPVAVAGLAGEEFKAQALAEHRLTGPIFSLSYIENFCLGFRARICKPYENM